MEIKLVCPTCLRELDDELYCSRRNAQWMDKDYVESINFGS